MIDAPCDPYVVDANSSMVCDFFKRHQPLFCFAPRHRFVFAGFQADNAAIDVEQKFKPTILTPHDTSVDTVGP